MITASSKRSRKLIVAIDGPSGAGKSSVTKALAERLGYIHIDTGAMFRTVALMAMRSGIDPDDHAGLADLCADLCIDFDISAGACRVIANGEDVSMAIRSPEISLFTSRVAAVPAVRSYLLSLQRKMAESGGVVLEGRDIGTVVFPDADVKFFLTASAGERGRRRFAELQAKGLEVSLEQTVAEVVQRDEQDLSREHAPLIQAVDAVQIDSTELSAEEVISKMQDIVLTKKMSF